MTFNITSMLNASVYDHPVKNIELIETHISWVILTGDFAYKIKKPVNFGFLDFSTLEKRHNYCKQELLLNRRFAPEIYLEVVSITEVQNRLRISADADAIEYAVRMKQFPQSVQLDNMLASNELHAEHMDAIAQMIADFHQRTNIADSAMEYGNSEMVHQPVEENFVQIKKHLDTDSYAENLATLDRWSSSEFLKLKSTFEQRKRNGFIRECHGDMHLRNLVWIDDKAMAFDCIEFNSKLRWIDVISEVAFLVMDLKDRQQHQLANRFLNSYMEITGDYSGLSVLLYYLVYRAMVRAKVNALRLEQKNISANERQQTQAAFESYLDLATNFTDKPEPKLIIMRGLSASGKSTVSQQLLDRLGAIRIRSDVERKRLFHTAGQNNTANKIDNGIYSAEASQLTYTHLSALATTIIDAGFSVIIDAAFLKHVQRVPFQKLAGYLNVHYVILEVTAPDEVLRTRIKQRKNDISDADLSVLEHQLSSWQPLRESEMATIITVNSTLALDANALTDKINKI